MNIKKIIISTILAIQATSALAGTISQSGSWIALTDSKHFAWQEANCRAATASDKNRSLLEVYSERQDGKYSEPTVQISTTKGYADVYRAQVRIFVGNKSYKTDFFAVNRSNQSNDSRVLLAKFSGREEIVNLLKAGSKVEAVFYNKNNSWMKKVVYSLTGSSATINNMMNTCGVGFNKIDL